MAGAKKADRYIGQVYQALMAHPEWFSQRPVVLAGDFHSNKIRDTHRLVGNHSNMVKVLEKHGLVSASHKHFSEPQGMESRPTMYFYRRAQRTFHLDYFFTPREWALRLKTVEVGAFESWSKLSAHCPVVVDVPSCRTIDVSWMARCSEAGCGLGRSGNVENQPLGIP